MAMVYYKSYSKYVEEQDLKMKKPYWIDMLKKNGNRIVPM